MKSNQLMNLYSFMLLFNQDYYFNQSPSYIKEKSVLFLGFEKGKDIDITKNENELKWCNLWGVSESEYSDLKGIVRFLDKAGFHRHDEVLNMFEEYIGNLDDINNNNNLKSLHPHLRNLLHDYLHKDYMKILMRECVINDLEE